MRVKKSDRVVVIAGKDKGKIGVVIETNSETKKVIVEGINIKTYHKKPTQINPEGGIIKQEGPIDVSNVMVVEGKGKNVVASKIGYRYEINEKSGKKNKIRFLKKNNQDI